MGRVPRIGARLAGWLGRPGAQISVRGALAPVQLVLWLACADLAVLLLARTPPASQALGGTLAALAFGLFAAVPACILGGLCAWAAWRMAPEREPWPRRLWALAWDGEPELQRRRVGRLGAVSLLALVWAAASFVGVRSLVIGMAQPHFTALAVVGLELALCIAAALLLSPLGDLCAVVLGGVARVPVLGRPLRTLGGALVLAAALAVAFAGLAAVVFREPLSYLPWSGILAGVAGVALSLAYWIVRDRLPRLVTRGLTAVALLAVCAGLFTGLSLDPRRQSVRRVASQQAVVGRLALPVLRFALDFDRDGHMGLFGEGDCAPLDPALHPGAVDVPDNGIDEDCDGVDLNGRTLAVRTRIDWPVPAAVPRRPPIVLITVDAFAAARMRALGSERDVTPRLDAFATRSAFFPYCFSQGPSTRLSFPSIFTSRWDSQIHRKLEGKHPYPIDESERMLAQEIAKAGYDTVAVLPDPYFGHGKWPSITRGFERVVERPYRMAHGRHNSALVTDEALKVLRQPRKDPLFLWAHYYDAHSPHTPPEGIPVRSMRREDVYEAELTLVDREVGRLLDGIEKITRGQALVIVTADHGIGFDAPRHVKLNYGYDLNTVILHVPLIVHAPFVPVARIDSLVSTMDVAPTLTNLLRLGRRFPFRGASLVPELLRGERSRPARLLHEFYIQERKWKGEEPLEIVALRTDRYNLIHDRRDGSYQLYDWRADYFEVEDLSDRPESQASFAALKQQLGLFMYDLLPRDERAEGRGR